jgi:hypothetical protein
MRRVAAKPKRTTSTGSGKAPSVLTNLLSSAITTIWSDAVATTSLATARRRRPDQPELIVDLVGAVHGEM